VRAGRPLAPPALYAPLSQVGVSEAAVRLQKDWEAFFKTVVSSVTMGTQYHQIQLALTDLARQASSSNWDGYGASAVNEHALGFAKRIARFLPLTLSPPEVSVDPDGEVAFDWRTDPRSSISFSIGPFGTLRYASINKGSENYGLEPWRDGLPESVARLIQDVVVHERTK